MFSARPTAYNGFDPYRLKATYRFTALTRGGMSLTARSHERGQAGLDEARHRRQCTFFRRTAKLELDRILGESLVPDSQPDRDAHEVGILELHPGSLVPVVDQDVDA